MTRHRPPLASFLLVLLTAASAAAAGGTSLGVELVVSLASGTKANADDVSLGRAS